MINYSKARKIVKYKNIKKGLSSIFQDPYDQTEIQKIALSVARKAIFNKNSNLMIAPISGTRYIQYNDIFIKIESRLLMIINGSYTYHVNLSDRDTEWILNKFNGRLENIRKQWEASITTKTTKSLSSILNDLTNNK